MGKVIQFNRVEKQQSKAELYDAYGRKIKDRKKVRLINPHSMKPFEKNPKIEKPKTTIIKPEMIKFIQTPENKIQPATMQEALWMMKKIRSKTGKQKPTLEETEETIKQIFGDRIEKTEKMTLPTNPDLREKTIEKWEGFDRKWVKQIARHMHELYLTKLEREFEEEIKKREKLLK